MKFEFGDDISNNHRVALQHEFLCCEDAFEDFYAAASLLMINSEDKQLAYTAYNAYARFIHHLYEFYVGAIKNNLRNTEGIKKDKAEYYITMEVQRILTLKRHAIINGYAPPNENGLNAYPEAAPKDFAAAFREVRNICHAHTTHKRATLNLSAFFERYHTFVMMLYREPKWLWGRQKEVFPDLHEVTNFLTQITTKRLHKTAPNE